MIPTHYNNTTINWVHVPSGFAFEATTFGESPTAKFEWDTPQGEVATGYASVQSFLPNGQVVGGCPLNAVYPEDEWINCELERICWHLRQHQGWTVWGFTFEDFPLAVTFMLVHQPRNLRVVPIESKHAH